ncbi:MAG TPA: glycoside hydrolase family 3 N-terminal domain-containing protein [Streptosporangiaceae bacterium]
MITSARNQETARAGRVLPPRAARMVSPIAAVVGAMALISCVSAGSSPAGSSAGGVAASGAASLRPAPSPRPDLPALTPEQMAGQRVIYSYSGLTPPASLLGWIRHGEAAGVIFFGGNIASTAQIAGVIKELDQANDAASNPMRKLPLLLMTDQEGGVVRRLPGAPVLSEKEIGDSPDPVAQAKAAGTGAGQNLASAGMNVNLAPVLDVYRAPGDFDDQFGRSYSMDPRVVSTLGADFIRSQQATGVAATAKHFPGLGAADVTENTDLRPVTLSVSLGDLRTTDEFPYRAAIAAGVKLVMVNWAMYPALDASRPAGLSPAVINGELRRRLGFTGVTITDALEAGALQPFGGIGHRATLAAGAGMDLILCSGQKASEGAAARTALASALSSGTLSKPAFSAALARVWSLRHGLH